MPVALVTGANRGIGYATACQLAGLGYDVVVASRRLNEAEEVANEIVDNGGRAVPAQLDVRDPTHAREVATMIKTEYGHLDLLVNNAGILPDDQPSRASGVFDAATITEAVLTNTLGAANVTDACLSLLKASPSGRIVNVSTALGSMTHQANPESGYYDTVWPGYQASKAALNSLTLSLAKILEPDGVKVTAVCPGFVRTDLTPANIAAPLSVDQGAAVVVRAASLPASAPSGTFIDHKGEVPW